MKKFLLAIMVVAGIMGVTPAYAESTAPDAVMALDCSNIDIRGKTSQQIVDLKEACEVVTGKEKSFFGGSSEKKVTPTDVKEWATLAKDFGSAIGAGAKEVGMAVNEFMVTPAGILITLYLFWEKIGGILIGIPFIFFIWYLYFKIVNHYSRQPEEITVTPVLFGLWSRKLITKYRAKNDSGDVLGLQLMLGLAFLIVTAIVIGTMIL